MADKQATLERMFLPEEHEYNEGNMVYVGIAPTIRRLNQLGEWNFDITTSEVFVTGKTTKSGKEIHRATVVASLHIPGLGSRSGSGSDESFDMDTAMKSAQAYALRKAANLFGVALYLWDEEGRNYAADPTDLNNLKRLVLLLARRRGFQGGTADDLALHLDVDPDYLQGVAGLTHILRLEGVIA